MSAAVITLAPFIDVNSGYQPGSHVHVEATVWASPSTISGQLSAARGAFGFLWPSVAVGMAAPVLAASVNWAWPATGSFVLGYLVVNVLLLAINARHALRTLQPAKP